MSMTTDRWQQVMQIFQSAIERPPSERDGFISQATAVMTQTSATKSNPSSTLIMKPMIHTWTKESHSLILASLKVRSRAFNIEVGSEKTLKEKRMPIRRVLSIVFLLPSFVIAQNAQRDAWEPFKYFVGSWEGTGKGQPGDSKTQREYKLVLNGKFLQVQNRSVYEPQAKNPKGEIHEDWGLLSFDKSRKQFVLRQFHVEGFVNQYVQTSLTSDGKTIVFTTEQIENIPAGWRARETYRIISPDEFVEVFELAEPGKDFELYSEGRYKRKK